MARGAEEPGKKLIACGQGKQELPETHLKAEEAEQPSHKAGGFPKLNIL